MRKRSKAREKQLKWQELSQEIRSERGNRCEICKGTSNLQVHHVCCSKYFKKSLLRFNPVNLLVVCPTCHFMCHKSPIQIMEWFRQNRLDDYNACLKILGNI